MPSFDQLAKAQVLLLALEIDGYLREVLRVQVFVAGVQSDLLSLLV